LKLTPVTLLLLLNKTRGNITEAGKMAGRNRNTVYAALKRYGMEDLRVSILRSLRVLCQRTPGK
jgi:DNA-binding NtrC family response regulator